MDAGLAGAFERKEWISPSVFFLAGTIPDHADKGTLGWDGSIKMGGSWVPDSEDTGPDDFGGLERLYCPRVI